MTSKRFDDHGQIAGVEGAIFGVLVFVLGSLLIMNGWGVVDAKVAAAAAAREATRTFVESTGDPDEAFADAEDAAIVTLSGLGRDPDRMEISHEEGSLARCSRVTFRVDYHVPLIIIPLIGRYGRGFVVTARHSEIVDPYRSGLRDSDTCPPELRR